ncbi:DUF1194 domain-containing protein [Methylobacterium mesophilicum]|uniref:DUF1194 domain-containing protein n=1 Tax=Methylobacterium mesophilicum TaxID=39956 RepID=UPI00361DDCA9
MKACPNGSAAALRPGRAGTVDGESADGFGSAPGVGHGRRAEPQLGAGPTDRTTLEHWYRAHVLGGPGAFLLADAGYGDFSRALRRKFVIAISALGR